MPQPSSQLVRARAPLVRIVPSRQAGASFQDSGFSPTQLNLRLWLRSDTGLWQNTGGTTPTAADADPVGRWDDQSGSGNNVTQGTSGKRPTLKLAIQNGLPVVRLDGIDDFLKAAAFTDNQPVWVFAALALRATSGANAYFWDGNTLDHFSAYQSVAGGLRMFAGTNGPLLTVGTAWHTVSCLYNGAASEAHLDGGVAVTGNTGTTNGDGFTLGAQTSGSAASALDVGELFIAPAAAVSAAARVQAENYLRTRWGTA